MLFYFRFAAVALAGQPFNYLRAFKIDLFAAGFIGWQVVAGGHFIKGRFGDPHELGRFVGGQHFVKRIFATGQKIFDPGHFFQQQSDSFRELFKGDLFHLLSFNGRCFPIERIDFKFVIITGKLRNLELPKYSLMAAALHIADEKLQLARLKEGDQRAFNYFYEQHSLIIYRRLKKMVKIDTLADEFLQDVFVRLWEKRHLIDPEQSLKAYLHLIAQNLVYDFYRKLARESRLQEEVKYTLSELHDATQEDYYLKETNDLLQKAINNLPAQQKLVFTLCKMEGKSYEEVGRDLGISTSTINGHIVKATKSVKSYMTDQHKVAFGLLISIALNELANKL